MEKNQSYCVYTNISSLLLHILLQLLSRSFLWISTSNEPEQTQSDTFFELKCLVK